MPESDKSEDKQGLGENVQSPQGSAISSPVSTADSGGGDSSRAFEDALTRWAKEAANFTALATAVKIEPANLLSAIGDALNKPDVQKKIKQAFSNEIVNALKQWSGDKANLRTLTAEVKITQSMIADALKQTDVQDKFNATFSNAIVGAVPMLIASKEMATFVQAVSNAARPPQTPGLDDHNTKSKALTETLGVAVR